MPDSRRPVRVGLLGFGHGGRVFHAPLISATPGMVLAAVVTRDPDRRRSLRELYPGVAGLDTADELWARAGEIDVAVIATPNRSHVGLARAAMAAGLAVVIDKPMAPTAAEARALVREARERGRLLTVFQNRRWDADFLTVRRLVGEGALGMVWRFESRYERWAPSVNEHAWRERATAEDAGGILFDIGAHLVDQALQLLGPARTVYAELDHRRAGAVIDDDAFVALAHASGARSHLWMSKAAAQRGPRFRVLGDRAAFTKHGLDGQEIAMAVGIKPDAPGFGEEPPDHWGVLGEGDSVPRVASARGGYLQFYAGVVAAVRDGAPLPVYASDAVAALDVIEAARASATRGEVISLADARARPG
ncbi:MAG TPA: Gfo/Idh/MocA family oxidoreductase [Kofleriaceae bacterium]|nr:Gfo/Idh/MocA family oxidoreductase [Kofleriaceae bacterium]